MRNAIALAIASLSLGAGAQSLVSGPAETVAEGFQFTEGPVWLASGELIFSDIPANRIYYGDKKVFRDPSGQSNGLTLDLEGRLVVAEHGNRRISRTEKDGTIVTLADRYEGKRLNSPNDVIVASDGSIYFTDPPYGIGGPDSPQKELDFCGVYRIAPDGNLSLLTKAIEMPNGLALAPDEKKLYVADSKNGFIDVFPVKEDETLGEGKRFADTQGPDGLKVDVQGRVWTTASDGVRVYSPESELVETIAFPQKPANCAFGGVDGKTLYVTARTGLYKVQTTVEGIRPAQR